MSILLWKLLVFSYYNYNYDRFGCFSSQTYQLNYFSFCPEFPRFGAVLLLLLDVCLLYLFILFGCVKRVIIFVDFTGVAFIKTLPWLFERALSSFNIRTVKLASRRFYSAAAFDFNIFI